jgi:hypothetical protein
MNNYWNGEGLPSVGQMVLHDNEGKAKVLAVKGNDVCCMFNEIDGLFLSHINQFKPIPNPKEIAKQKAIENMYFEHIEHKKLPPDTIYELIEFAKSLYNDGYTNKIKPLPEDWHDMHHHNFDIHQLTFYHWLIANGYCIGSAD